MLSLSLERLHKAILVRFSGTVTREDFASLDKALDELSLRGSGLRSIVDMSMIDAFDVSSDFLRQRAQRTAILGGADKVFVAPRADQFGVSRMFTTTRSAFGHSSPTIVRTIEEAYTALDLASPKFEPL
jgi:hypothetical protein